MISRKGWLERDARNSKLLARNVVGELFSRAHTLKAILKTGSEARKSGLAMYKVTSEEAQTFIDQMDELTRTFGFDKVEEAVEAQIPILAAYLEIQAKIAAHFPEPHFSAPGSGTANPFLGVDRTDT
ncbi:MAG: hypothetical protein K2X47_02515, partial [Bdellovibrionales bacterium]|nr:hypothetical protein [Bdellovibrionales bacterium]